MDILFCTDASPVFHGLFDFSIAPPLLYYSYIPIVLISIVFAGFALWSNHGDRNSKYLALLSVALVFYVLATLLTWIAAPTSLVMFGWQMWSLTTAFVFMTTTFFVYSLVFDKEATWPIKSLLLVLLLPIIILTPTTLNIEVFDVTNCEGWITDAFLFYTYFYCVVSITLIVVALFKALLNPTLSLLPKKLVLAVTLGAITLLSSFLFTFILGDLFFYELEIIGPVGMVIFIGSISYVSVNYQRFNMRIFGSEFLIIGLACIVGSIVFVQSILYVRYVAIGSLILIILLGYILVRSIRKEAKQKKEIENLAVELETANVRLKQVDQMKSEFVSIASHQLRSPLTSIRGYTSMLLEGSYGRFPEKAKSILEHIAESSRFMAMSVEDYLNVSRIESGNMKYAYSDFNLKEATENIVDELRQECVKRGLLLTFKSDIKSRGIVHADVGKVRQVVQNLIDNAMKYTKKGSIKVYVYDNKKINLIYVDVTDTGIGMSEETIKAVFAKFERAHNANEVNVTGTGLGLYVARTMARSMKGDVRASSGGEGKGSTFSLELPLMM